MSSCIRSPSNPAPRWEPTATSARASSSRQTMWPPPLSAAKVSENASFLSKKKLKMCIFWKKCTGINLNGFSDVYVVAGSIDKVYDNLNDFFVRGKIISRFVS